VTASAVAPVSLRDRSGRLSPAFSGAETEPLQNQVSLCSAILIELSALLARWLAQAVSSWVAIAPCRAERHSLPRAVKVAREVGGFPTAGLGYEPTVNAKRRVNRGYPPPHFSTLGSLSGA